MEERHSFIRYMRQQGVDMSAYGRRLDLQPPLDDSGDTDCWTHAARYVEQHPDAFYVEGICRRPPQEDGRARISAHAWVVEDTPLGMVIVELTPGYENAFAYKGMPLATDTAEYARALHDGIRYSVIELHLAVGALIDKENGS